MIDDFFHHVVMVGGMIYVAVFGAGSIALGAGRRTCLKLYGSTISRAHRVMWMLKELEVAFEHIPTNFLDGSTRHPDFLKVNPNGRVPVIDDDGVVLFESMAINLYLAKKHPTAISPADRVEDALATQWSFWVVTEIEKPLLLAAANSFLFEEALRNEEERQMALRKLDRPWTVLEKSLSRSPLFDGRTFHRGRPQCRRRDGLDSDLRHIHRQVFH